MRKVDFCNGLDQDALEDGNIRVRIVVCPKGFTRLREGLQPRVGPLLHGCKNVRFLCARDSMNHLCRRTRGGEISLEAVLDHLRLFIKVSPAKELLNGV